MTGTAAGLAGAGTTLPGQSRDAGRVAVALLVGLAGAVAVRRGIDGWPGATSVVAAAVFVALLLGLSLFGSRLLGSRLLGSRLLGSRPPESRPPESRPPESRPPELGPPESRSPGPAPLAGPRPGRAAGPAVAVLAGLAGAAVLCTGPLVRHLADPGAQLPGSRLPVWAAAVAGVAVAEEVLLRGVLWRAVTTWAGGRAAAPWIALAVTTAAFALLHVPFYGVGSLPVDLAAGVLLGALRQCTGSVTAPAAAHLAADLAGWWLQ